MKLAADALRYSRYVFGDSSVCRSSESWRQQNPGRGMASMKKITELESAISAVDRELLEILKRRFGMARQLADLKRGSGQSPDHLDRLG
ncbi:MAG: chorismate mutase, partial [Candidatus Pacebacteria bacterium]|nr:chorismate mutase [Candidatus Paceibacterota bacterium]